VKKASGGLVYWKWLSVRRPTMGWSRISKMSSAKA